MRSGANQPDKTKHTFRAWQVYTTCEQTNHVSPECNSKNTPKNVEYALCCMQPIASRPPN